MLIIVLNQVINYNINKNYDFFIYKNDLKLTDITSKVTYSKMEHVDEFIKVTTEGGNEFTIPANIYNDNKNIYIEMLKIITDDSIKTTDAGKFLLHSPSIDNVIMNNDDYIHLAKENLILNKFEKDPNNNNITYNMRVYYIPINSSIIKVETNKDLDIPIYNYELGPIKLAEATILNRKQKPSKSLLLIDITGHFFGLLITLMCIFLIYYNN
jgi:hypothetical protein